MAINNDNVFGQNTKSLRNIFGVKQEELADRLNIARNTLSYYENGNRGISDDIKRNIANFFMLTVDQLLYDDYSFVGVKSSKIEKDYFLRNIDVLFPFIIPRNIVENKAFMKAYHLHLKAYEKLVNKNIDGILYDILTCCSMYIDVIHSSIKEKDSKNTMSYYGVVASLNLIAIRTLMVGCLYTACIAIKDKTAICTQLTKTDKGLKEVFESDESIEELLEEMKELLDAINEIVAPELICVIKEIAGNFHRYSDFLYYYLALEYVFKISDSNLDHNRQTMIGMEMLNAFASAGNIYAKANIKLVGE